MKNGKKRFVGVVSLVTALLLLLSGGSWGLQAASAGEDSAGPSVDETIAGNPGSVNTWTLSLSSELKSNQLPETIQAGDTLKLSCRLYGPDTQVPNPWRQEEGYRLWSDEFSWQVLGSRFLAYPDFLYSLEGAPNEGKGEMEVAGANPSLSSIPRPDYGGLLEIELRARIDSPAGLRLTTEVSSPGGFGMEVSSQTNRSEGLAPAGSRTLAEIGRQDPTLQKPLDLNAIIKPPARVGTFKPLVVLVDFPDNQANVASTRDFYQNLLFAPTGISMTTFFAENSWNQLNLQGNVVWNQAGTAWVRTTTTYAWYVNNEIGMGAYPQNTQRLTEDVLNLIDPYVNFSNYDGNGDGVIDGLMVIYAGPAGGSTRIWPHQWSITPQVRDSIQISTFCMQPEYNSTPLDTDISVYFHEYSHVLGAYDLYDYDYTSAGVGLWSLMAWDDKQHLDPWHKFLLGWITPTVQSSNATGLLIPAVETTKLVYRLNLGDPSEYYLVENRTNLGYDQNLPGWGLLIWHVDEDATSGRINNNEWYPPDRLDSGHYTVALEQADGLYELEKGINGGNAGDPFTNGSSFTPITNPSSCDYQGCNWNVQLTNISAPGSSATTDFSFNLNYPVITWWPLQALSFLLQGSANPNGQNTQAWFEWGTTIAYGSTTSPVNLGSGTIPQTFTATFPIPVVITDYHFRAVCQNTSGTFFGEDKTFTMSPGQWTQLPLYGGSIYALAIDPVNPQTLYAGTEMGGIFKSTNGGASWIYSSSGLTNVDVWSLAVNPNNSQTLYAGTWGGGVCKSTNGGTSWSSSSNGLTNVVVPSLAVDPNNSQTLYAGTWYDGVFKSSDGGASWTASSSGLTDSFVRCMAVDPNNSQTLYAGTSGNGVCKSTNGGTSWSSSSSGLTDFDVRSLAVDPNNSQTLYTGTWYGGVFKSSDGGASWTASSSGLTYPSVYALAITPSDPQTLFAGTWGGGVCKSSDGGASWAASSSGLTFPSVYSFAIDTGNSQVLYTGTGCGGVFKSSDSGTSWTKTSRGLTNVFVRSMAINPVNPQTLYAGTVGYGVLKSGNGGASWSSLSTFSGLAFTVFSLAIDPVNPQTLYAGTWGDGVYKSTNGGASWTTSSTGLTDSYVWCLAIDPTNSQTLYAGTDGGGVCKSSNSGSSWTASSIGLTSSRVWSLAIDPVNPQTLYAGTSSNGVCKSSDGGASWATSPGELTNIDVECLAIDPSNPQTLYAATGCSRVWKSTNGGASWVYSSSGLTGNNMVVDCLAIDPVNPQTLYAGTWDHRVFKSTNGGASWSSFSSGLTYSRVQCLVIDPSNSQTLYAGTYGSGVCKWIPGNGSSLSLVSPNSGEQWGVGSSQTITWISSGVTGNIDIAISRDGGATYSNIITNTFNDGSQAWMVTTPTTTQARIKVSSVSNPTILDISDTFTITEQSGHWEQLPLYGGNIFSLAIDPNNSQTLYVGTNGGGVFKSTNGGASWTASSTGLTNGCVRSLAIDPLNSQTLYAGIEWDGAFKSINGGASWTRSSIGLSLSPGLTCASVMSLAIDPSNSQTLYAGIGGGVFKSTNGGASWTASSSGLTKSNVQSLAIDPSNSRTLYAGTSGNGVFKSSDGGASWTASSTGLASSDVHSLAIDSSNSQIIYAGTFLGGVFKSINGGTSWTASSTGLTNSVVYCLVLDPSNSQILYAGTELGGVFKSSDGGASWSSSSTGLANRDVMSLAIDPINSQVLYAGTFGGGVCKSSDSGTSWNSSSSGLTNSNVQSLAIDPNNPQTLYAGTYRSGVFKSRDGGATWPVSSTWLTNMYVYSLVIDPSNSRTLYAGTSGNGVFKSSDGGASWTVSSSGITDSSVFCLAIDPSNSQTLYAGTYYRGVFKSSDGGVSWTASSTGLTNSDVHCLAIDSSNPQTLYAGTWSGGVFKSSDGGVSWTASSTGLTNSVVYCLVLDPSNSQILYAGTELGGVFKSSDGGVSWNYSGLTSSVVYCLAVDPYNSQILYAGTSQTLQFSISGGEIFKSSDGGISWNYSGLMSSVVYCLAIDPNNSQTLYAGTFGGGVFKYTPSGTPSLALTSPDGGENWGVDTNQYITWTSTNLTGNVKIELSRNGGLTYTETIAASVSVSAGSYSWVVTGPTSSTCRLRITSETDPSAFDTSDRDFVISTLPSITFIPTEFTFSCTQSQANPPLQTLEIWNAGTGTLNWTVNEGAGWLSLMPTSGSSTGEHDPVTVSVNASGLVAGTYTATITLAAAGADNSPQQVPVTLIVEPQPPVIGFAPSLFTFTATAGKDNPADQILSLWNGGEAPFNWTVAGSEDWLTLLPTGGTNDGSVAVGADTTGLAAGTYSATIIITAPGADNSPQQVPVTLTLVPATITFDFNLVVGWNMISLPVMPASTDPNVVFGGLPPGWVIYAWDAVNGRYIGQEQIVLGLTQGYWLKLSRAVEYSVSGLPNGAAQTGIDLGLGWNLIGVPYEGVIPWGAVRVSKDGDTPVSLDQAVASNWIQNTFFRWQGSAYQGLTTGGTLQSLSGYWVKTKVTGVQLVFMKP